MMRKMIVTTGLAVGLVLAPGAALADTTVQNQNTSENSSAESGDAYAVNASSSESGPKANSGAGNASAQQNGNDHSETHQSSSAKSGDAVAGSQSTGVVSGGGGDTTVQNQNTSKNATAKSGNAVAVNLSATDSGPEANSVFGDASAQQNGSNTTVSTSTASAASGDAVSGSQVTGIV